MQPPERCAGSSLRETPRGSPAVANGVVYASDYGGQVYAPDAVTGSELWSYDIGSFLDSSPVVVNGMVFVGTNEYQIYAFTLP
jgi:eukaryotic-like serine/threonine-protein kinase